MVLLVPTVTALQTLLEVCHAYSGPHDICTTQRKQYVCGSGRSNHRVSTWQESGSEMRNLALSRSFVTLVVSWLLTVNIIRILKNNLGGKMQWAICWSGSYHLYLLRQKSNCSSHIVTQFMDVLFGVIHSRTQLENLLTVIVTHSSVLFTRSMVDVIIGNIQNWPIVGRYYNV